MSKQKIEVILSNSGNYHSKSLIVLYKDKIIVNYYNHTTTRGRCEDDKFISQGLTIDWLADDIDLEAIIDPTEYDECSGYTEIETDKLEKKIIGFYKDLNMDVVL